MKKNTIEVEEDGDEVFTMFPKFCLKWECYSKKVMLKKKDGLMKCPSCGSSYGRLNEKPE